MRSAWMTRLMKPCVVERSLSLPPVSLSYEDLKLGHPQQTPATWATAPLWEGWGAPPLNESLRSGQVQAGPAHTTKPAARSSALRRAFPEKASTLSHSSVTTRTPTRASALHGTAPSAIRPREYYSDIIALEVAHSRPRPRRGSGSDLAATRGQHAPHTPLASVTAGHGDVGSQSKLCTTTHSHLRLQEHEEMEEDDPQIKHCKMTTTQKTRRN